MRWGQPTLQTMRSIYRHHTPGGGGGNRRPIGDTMERTICLHCNWRFADDLNDLIGDVGQAFIAQLPKQLSQLAPLCL